MFKDYLRVLDKLDEFEEMLMNRRLMDSSVQGYLDNLRLIYESKIVESGDYPRGV